MDNNIVKDKRCTPSTLLSSSLGRLYFKPPNPWAKKLPGHAAPTVFDQKRPSKNEARNLNTLLDQWYFRAYFKHKSGRSYQRQRPSTVLL